MVRDAVMALIALVVSLPAILVMLKGLDWLLGAIGFSPYDYPLLHALHAAGLLAAWSAVARVLRRLDGPRGSARFRTALAAFPVTLAWPVAVNTSHPLVLWMAHTAPLVVAMLAHAGRLALARQDTDGDPIVTKDDRGRAAAAHAMGALGALFVIATLFIVPTRLSPSSSYGRYGAYYGQPAAAELWVWAAIVGLAITIAGIYRILERAPGSDPRYPDADPIEFVGAGLTLGLLGIAVIGWVLVAISFAHTLGPQILAGTLHLVIVLLSILAWLQLQALLERWRTSYGGKVLLDAFGCALLVVAGALMLWLAMLAALIGWITIGFYLCLLAPLAFAIAAALSLYFLPGQEYEPIARIVLCALALPFIGSILARWRLPDSMFSRHRDDLLLALAWLSAILIVATIVGILARHGYFDEFTGTDRTTRNSRIDDGGPADTMRRE